MQRKIPDPVRRRGDFLCPGAASRFHIKKYDIFFCHYNT